MFSNKPAGNRIIIIIETSVLWSRIQYCRAIRIRIQYDRAIRIRRQEAGQSGGVRSEFVTKNLIVKKNVFCAFFYTYPRKLFLERIWLNQLTLVLNLEDTIFLKAN